MPLPPAKFTAGGAVATEADLLVLKDKVRGESVPLLASAISAIDDTFTVGTGEGGRLPGVNSIVVIEAEHIFVAAQAGDVSSSLVRGVNGTTAAPHVVGEEVNPFIIAAHHNQLAAEIIALEDHIDSLWGNNLTSLWRPNLAKVPSIQAWYRPDEIILGSPDLDVNGNLAVWKDRSGKGRDATPPSTLPSVALASLNGYATVGFGIGSSLSTPSIPRLHGVDATIFAVFRSATANNSTLISQQADSNRTATLYIEFNNEFFADLGNISGGKNRLIASPPPFGVNSWEILTIERTASAGEVWRNGSSIITSVDFDSINVPTDSQPFYIGVSFSGDLVEVGVCNAAGLHEKLEGYLAHKFALQGLLPAGHLYKIAAP